jgi:hypothetical protein
MNTRLCFALLLGLLCVLLLANGTLAMSSANYRLDWFTPLTGSGGPASSTHYAVNVTVGQTAPGVSASANYGGCLGYWCGGETEAGGLKVYLPLVLKP